ncbi:SET domain-containing protein [Candidatus Uhrbacteria bacterium]|nr:SET domain-containing protein [Candidatus Uhrbacteria bacterium]
MHPTEYIELQDTGRYGRSLFAKKDFKKDEIVFTAYGPIVSQGTIYSIPIDHHLRIDPKKSEGNICWGLCHSCDPNLGVKDRTSFVAFRDIKKGEEVRPDYGMFCWEFGEEGMTEGDLICHCNSSICRGRLGCYKELPPDIRKKYAGYISDYLLDPRYH